MFFSVFDRLKKPHREKKEKLLNEIKNYNELSETAMLLGDREAYQALQERNKEAYFEMLAASILESITSLVPHFVIMWLLSLKFKQISVFGFTLEVIVYYPLAIIIYLVIKKLVNQHKKLKQN
jgi:ABC-type multidrug transport system fused ATPase/permease subunit